MPTSRDQPMGGSEERRRTAPVSRWIERVRARLARSTRTSSGPPPCVGCLERATAPHLVEARADRSADLTDVPTPVPGLLSAEIDGQLVVFEPTGGRALVLNASAALIVTAFDGDRPLSAIVDQLVTETRMDATTVRDDVLATTDRLWAADVISIGTAGTDQTAPPEPDDLTTVAHDPPPTPRTDPAPAWCVETGPLRLAGTAATVRIVDPAIGRLIEPLLVDLTSPDDEPHVDAVEHLVEVRGTEPATVVDDGAGPNGDGYVVIGDGDVVARPRSVEHAVTSVLHHLDALAISGSRRHVILHAGAVARDGEVVVLMGRSGRGKSTLTAALVKHGFAYLSDEVVAITGDLTSVEPYRKALDLYPQSRSLLDLATADASLGESKDKVVARRLGTLGDGGRPTLLVYLEDRSDPGASPTVAPADALVALLSVTFEQTVSRPEHFEAMARLCATVPAVRIGRAPLDTMIASIEDALAEVSGGSVPG